MVPQLRDLQLTLRDPPTVAAGLACLLFLGGVGWLMFGAGLVNPADARFTHMHCSECLEEFLYSPKSANKACSACKGSSVLVPTMGSRSEGGESATGSGRVLVFIVLFAIVSQGFVYGAILRGRRLRERDAALLNRRMVIRCSFCQRKLAVPASKAGSPLVCPRCKTAFIVPCVADVSLS